MNKRFLVVVHAGDAALPAWWLADAARRDWDLAVVGSTVAAATGTDHTIALQRSGPKWPTLALLLADTRDAWAAYEHVWIADAAIESSVDDVNRLFAVVASLGLPLAQPSFAAGSGCSHAAGLHNDAFALRFTAGVDATAPVFSRELLLRALPLLAGNPADAVLCERLPQLLAQPQRECAVIDRVVVRRRGAAPAVGTADHAYGGYDRDGALTHPFDGGAEAFVGRLAQGWAALDTNLRDALLTAQCDALGIALPAAEAPPASLIVGTRLSAHDAERQRTAIGQWRAAGLEPVAFHTADEIHALQAAFPDLSFVECPAVPRLDEVIGWFAAQNLAAGGWLPAGTAIDSIDFEALPGSVLYARSGGTLQALFWDAAVLPAFDGAGPLPVVGDACWGETALLLPLAAGVPVRPIGGVSAPAADAPAPDAAAALALFDAFAARATWRPAQDRRLADLLLHLLPQRGSADAALGAVLSLWFDDLLARNTEGHAAQPVATADTPPELSVVIPSFNRADILARCLQHLAAQTLDGSRFEVIVVDDGSADHTAAVLRAAPPGLRLTALQQPNLGPAAARNRGLSVAQGHWVLFLNDDALLEPDALAIHLDEHARRGPHDAVLGTFPMHPDFTPATHPVGYCMDHTTLVFDYPRMHPGQAYGWNHFYTCNISLARELVLAVGGFDEGFVRMGAEDVELGLRLQRQGCNVYYRPDCVARHAHRLDATGLARMYEFRGKGGVHLFARHTQFMTHYADVPLARVAEFNAQHARLQPLLQRLRTALDRADAADYVATGEVVDPMDQPAARLDFRTIWRWGEDQMVRFIDAIAARVERVADDAAQGQAPSLERAAALIFPALLFLKWYHDTVGIFASDELPAYLLRMRDEMPRAA